MKKKVLAVLLLIILVLGFSVLNKSSNELSKEEKDAALSHLLGRNPVLSDKTPKGNTRYSGKYLSFDYPKAAKVYTVRDKEIAKDKNTLEYFSFDMQTPRIVLNLSVAQTFIQSLNDFPGVRVRENSSLYSKSAINQGEVKGLVFTRDDKEAEETAFFLKNGKIYTFSLTGSNFKAIDSLWETILKNLKFL